MIQKKHHSQTSYLSHACLGGAAGLFMETTLHPMEAIRTKIKTNRKESVRFLTQMKVMYKRGGVASYYRGLSCTLSGAYFAYGTYFYTYERLKDDLEKYKHLSENFVPFAAAFAAGLASNAIYLPFIMVRTRMMMGKGHYDYKNFLDGAQKVARYEGFKQLYHGGPVLLTQAALETSLIFGLYEMFHSRLKPYFGKGLENQWLLSAISSFGAASLTAVIINPLDVLVSRLQTSDQTEGSIKTFKMVKKIYRSEGFGGFMKGVSGATVQSSIAAFMLLPTYEMMRSFWNKPNRM